MSRARDKRWNGVSWTVSFVVLAGVLWAISRGVAPGRLWPVAGFLAVWFAVSTYVPLAERAIRGRAARLQGAAVPRGVRLDQPVWIPLADVLPMVPFGAAPAAVAAAVGFPGVGMGILLTVATMGTVGFVFMGSTALTFEPTGLRVHRGRCEFFVPWTCVVDVDVKGPSTNQSTNVTIVARDQILTSLTPNTSRSRLFVDLLLALGDPRGRALAFSNWTAGLDSATLARGIREAMGERPSHAN